MTITGAVYWAALLTLGAADLPAIQISASH
jgi:hypothetical protein